MVSQEFIKNVNAGDIVSVRSALLDDLIVDKSFQLFDDELKYASEKMPIIEQHDGLPFELDTGKWNMRYLNQQKAALMVNFSEKRIKHLKEVISAVMVNEKVEPATPEAQNLQQNKRTGRTVVKRQSLDTGVPSQRGHNKTAAQLNIAASPNPSKTGKKVLSERELPTGDEQIHKSTALNYKTAMVVGGAVVSAVGIAVSEPVVVGAGVVVAGTGIVLAVADKQK